MAKGTKERFFIVSADILPEAIRKTAQAKELLARQQVATVNEAVEKVGLSRSAFYKYKDGVFPLSGAGRGNMVTISLILEHRAGILSEVLNTIAAARGNILTINQGIPLQGVANVTISLETAEMVCDLESLLEMLQGIKGAVKVELIGQS